MQECIDEGTCRDAVEELVKNAKPRIGRAVLDLTVWCWGMMIGCLSVFIIWPNVWTFSFAFLAVTSRMGALLALAHEAQHKSFLPSKKWNDRIGAWLCAYPMGSIYGSSRAVHMTHHKLLNHPDDPDRGFHIETDKASPRQFAMHFLRLVFGGQLWTSIILNGILRPLRRDNRETSDVVVVNRRGHPEILNIVPVQLIIWGSLYLASGYWWLYLAIWLGPIFTLGTFVGFLRGFVDHAKLVADDDGPGKLRLISVRRINLIERWFLAVFDFQYHAEHHMYPSVPHYYLPELHRLMQADEKYRSQYLVRESYTGFLCDYWRQISKTDKATQVAV